MPELPEVNTLVAALDKQLGGDSIRKWHRYSAKLRKSVPDASECVGITGRKIIAVKRLAKSIYFDFGSRDFLHVHLGMTGSFVLNRQKGERLAHEHLVLELGSGRFLHYFDPRRFGVVELTAFPEHAVCEPFVGQLTWQYLAARCRGSKRSIKSLIMDQSIIAGLGNIYAAEALLLSGVLPFRAADTLSTSEIKELCKSAIKVIDLAIQSGLQSLPPEFSVDADTTHFPIVTHVYGREGQRCGRCQTGQVMRVVIAGRSSCYCPICQH